MFENYIESCGGIDNIRRVLSSNGQIIFEINQQDDLDKSILHHYNDHLSQVSFTMPEASDNHLLEVGRLISKRQANAVNILRQTKDCPYRPAWHISPPTGLLNDPNGFILHDGHYHLFYQWSPFHCQHVDKYWAHLTSTDLVNWHTHPVALTPSDWFDSHGVFSGHAISTQEQLMLFYTGNVRIGEQRERQTTQCLAVSKDGIHFEKLGPVIDSLPDGVTAHCRDPKVIRIDNEWWMLLGVQKENLQGRLAVYKSKDLYHWQFDNLYGEELGDFGYMWECPDLFELNGQHISVIGPQGISSTNEHHTCPHHNGYLKTTISEKGHLSLSEFSPLDHGFDFYAPQSLETADGKRILTAWMGLPDEIDHPTANNGWVHQLTCPRELTYIDGRLIQQPAKALTSLRLASESFTLDNQEKDLQTKSFELRLELNWGDTLSLFKDNNNEVTIECDKENKILRLNRSKTQLNTGDVIREVALNCDRITLQLLADNSSLEMFINHGEFVMSSRIFTPTTAKNIALIGKADIQFWPLTSALFDTTTQ